MSIWLVAWFSLRASRLFDSTAGIALAVISLLLVVLGWWIACWPG